MNPDRAAELLQLPERGMDLLRRFEEDESIRKAITAVQSGFPPADVANMYGIDYEKDEDPRLREVDEEGSIFIYECQTQRCKQKGRVATSGVGPFSGEDPPSCPGCKRMMGFVKATNDEMELENLRRTYVPRARIADPLARTDKGKSGGWDDEDD